MTMPRARRTISNWFSVLALVLAVAWPCTALADEPMMIGGCGGAYLLAEPGELVVDVFKRDRNTTDKPSILKAMLVGPDRQIVGQAVIPDDDRPKDSGMGPFFKARLTAKVERQGIYVLNVTFAEDRYGDRAIWGLTTNCPRYLIESSRGHRDRRHEEPIVLAGGDQPADVCFHPQADPIRIDVSALPANVEKLTLYDAAGQTLAELPVADGKTSVTIGPDVPRDAPFWRLRLPRGKGVVEIDGLTRWGSNDPDADQCLWTPDASTWFDLPALHWLITPYHRVLYRQPGDTLTATFDIYNHTGESRTIDLAIEADINANAQVTPAQVELAPYQTAQVVVTCPAPSAAGQSRDIHIRATPRNNPQFSTYATLTAAAGQAPAMRSFDLPLKLLPYQHENQLLGYEPSYPNDWEMYFDLNNQPIMRSNRDILALRDGGWTTLPLRQTAQGKDDLGYPKLRGISKIAFDSDNDIYIADQDADKTLLWHSSDDGKSFEGYDLGPQGAVDIEHFTGHNMPSGPPPVLRAILTEVDEAHFWRKLSRLEMFLPRKQDGRLVIGEPILVAEGTLGVGSHSGIPAAVVSRGSKVHLIWGIATDPDKPGPGVPTYVATYDRDTQQFEGEPALIGYGEPPNDVHNRPSITIDSKGYLHALTGTHSRTFYYARSLQPDTAAAGWTEAAPVADGLRQTYIGLVCDQDDTLHLVYRLWADHQPPALPGLHAELEYQRKKPGQPWEAPRALVISPLDDYSIFYHRLGIDRLGRLFVSYDYWSTYWFYRNDHRGARRAMMMSPDGGDTWKLVDGADLSR
ncbi:MAG: BNR-4 repeat-containing protein [Phycisphaeraceae bacterium]|nr:BNR-4 repeat-containing protein [Phycisphaeraceae bacterium]